MWKRLISMIVVMVLAMGILGAAAETPPADFFEKFPWLNTTMEDYAGTWYQIYFHNPVVAGVPMEMWGDNFPMVLRLDGTGKTWDDDEDKTWRLDAYGSIVYDELSGATLLPDGFLQWGNEKSGYVIYSRDPNAKWDESTPLWEDLWEAAYRVPEPDTQVLPVGQPDITVSSDGNGEILLDVKYLCKSYVSGGYQSDASALGAEYAVTFHADGSADFIMAGSPVPGLMWTMSGTDAVIDYYGQAELRFVPADQGLWMNFFDTMDLFFVPVIAVTN